MDSRERKPAPPLQMPTQPPSTATPEELEEYQKAVIRYGSIMAKREYYQRNKARIREHRKGAQTVTHDTSIVGGAATVSASESLRDLHLIPADEEYVTLKSSLINEIISDLDTLRRQIDALNLRLSHASST